MKRSRDALDAVSLHLITTFACAGVHIFSFMGSSYFKGADGTHSLLFRFRLRRSTKRVCGLSQSQARALSVGDTVVRQDIMHSLGAEYKNIVQYGADNVTLFESMHARSDYVVSTRASHRFPSWGVWGSELKLFRFAPSKLA